jgi:hypothetical protein
MSNNLPEGCFVVDDGGPQFIVVEADDGGSVGINIDRQALWVRVEPVFDGDVERDEPGVWVNYQESYLAGSLTGSVLLTPRVWRQLVHLVAEKLNVYNREVPGRGDVFL